MNEKALWVMKVGSKKLQWKVFLNYLKVNVTCFLVSSKASVRHVPPGFPFYY